MKLKDLDVQMRNYKVREGFLFKRSRYFKEWRERWIVLTMNFIISFENRECQNVTEVIHLKDFRYYKSYVKKNEEMISSGFKLVTNNSEFVFCARNANQKWSWIVSIQRIMDYKEKGASEYNNIDQIKTKGFDSQDEFYSRKKRRSETFSTISSKDNQQMQEANQILKKLIQQQEHLFQKQMDLKHFEEQLIKKSFSQEMLACSFADLSQNQIENQLPSREEDFFCIPAEQPELKTNAHQLKKDGNFNQLQLIECVFQQFETALEHHQKTLLLQFLINLSTFKEKNYQQFIYSEISNNKNSHQVIDCLVERIHDISIDIKHWSEINQILHFLKFSFINKKLNSKIMNEIREKLLLWRSLFKEEMEKSEDVSLLEQLLCLIQMQQKDDQNK